MSFNYTITINFTANNIHEAEDYAAHVQEKAGGKKRVGLWYSDPLTGNVEQWAEPVMNAAQLQARRNNE